MKITAESWEEYIRSLSRLNEEAGQKMAEYIARHGAGDPDTLIAYAQARAQKYGEGSAELACQMYDAMARASGAQLPPAEPAAPADISETARMVNGTRQSPPLLQGGVSRLVKQTAADTTLKNAIRDGAEFAWIPHGDSCAFCIVLASRGWQRASKAALKNGHAEHIHANCDCEYAVRFDGRSTVAGYDPEQYLARYEAAGGDINELRRGLYAKTRDRINAQKRAAWAARKAADRTNIYSSLHQEYQPVTMEAIKRVKAFPCETLDAAGGRQLQNAHKRLLTAAAAKPLGVEVGRAYDRELRPLTQLLTGPSSGGSIRIPDFAQPYIALHTHPDCNIFSPADLSSFVARPNLRMLTAVGHDGHVFALEKTGRYDVGGAKRAVVSLQSGVKSVLQRNMPESETLSLLEKQIRQCLDRLAEYGVKFYE